MGESPKPRQHSVECERAPILAQRTGRNRVPWAPSRLLVKRPTESRLLHPPTPHGVFAVVHPLFPVPPVWFDKVDWKTIEGSRDSECFWIR